MGQVLRKKLEGVKLSSRNGGLSREERGTPVPRSRVHHLYDSAL